MNMEDALLNGLHNGFAIVGVLLLGLWFVWGKGIIDRSERFLILQRLAGALMDDYETLWERNERLQAELDSLKNPEDAPED